jgi:hypothetical protein
VPAVRVGDGFHNWGFMWVDDPPPSPLPSLLFFPSHELRVAGWARAALLRRGGASRRLLSAVRGSPFPRSAASRGEGRVDSPQLTRPLPGAYFFSRRHIFLLRLRFVGRTVRKSSSGHKHPRWMKGK